MTLSHKVHFNSLRRHIIYHSKDEHAQMHSDLQCLSCCLTEKGQDWKPTVAFETKPCSSVACTADSHSGY